MSHHNIGDSNSTNSSSEHSDNEERMFPDEDDEEDDEEEEDDDDDDYDEDDESSLPKNPLYPGEYPAPKQAKDYPTQPIIENLHDSKSNNFHWATLYSNNYSPKTIDIAQEKLFIGKGGSSHVALEDVNVEVSLVYIRPGEASLEITSTSGFVYVNQKPVRKGERVILQNKNEIGFYYSKTFIFTIFFNMHPSSHTQNIIPFDYSQIIPDNELPVKKFCQIDAPPRSCVSQEESLHAIFEKYGTRRISQTSPEEQAMRKQQNDEMWKYIKPHEKEAILYSCIIPFQYPHLIKYTKSLCSLYRTTLLTGPKGSMKFLSRVIRAVADYYDVPMLSVKFKALGQTVDASSQKKGFHERQQVKFIGKGKRQREYFDEIELGTRGIVLYVKDSKAAVNFEIGERSVGSFVDVEYLGNINEEIPEYDQRVIGRLEELTDKYGPLIVSIFDIGSLNENQIFQDFKAFLRNFKFTDNKSVIFGTMVTPPPAPKTQTVQQLEPSLCMIGMKEMRFVESFPLFKNAKEQQKSLSTVTKLFGNCINVTEPSSDLLRTWKVMVADDNKITRISKNRSLLSNEAQKYGVKILQYPEDEMTEQLTQEQVIKSLGHSIQYQNNKGLNPKELPKDALAYGLSLTRVKKEVDFEELDTDNEFEKKLLGDVIRAEDIAVSFDDIGALEDVKKILNETITLPLVRPELFFSKLTQGAKGVLLFGPPGTGKTMLAKAVATESKSNFINVSMSSLGSKWFGEAEKYVKALFTLASKLSPCVIFVDEVDALLGKRSSSEHEAVRKMKNEFMALWDGIKSKDMERVIVMAATNRPFDLDDAVLRRLSRRILVDLPNEKNRETILKKILRSEDVDENINFSIISQESDGFSGSDLFSLCQIVAMRPIKEFLKSEKDKPFEQRDKNPKLRPINTQDFLDELKKISPSVSKDSTSLNELRNWNTLYGEGSSVASKRLTYFL